MDKEKKYIYEPTSNRANKIIEKCYESNMSLFDTCGWIAQTLADKNNRVHIKSDDLTGLILNIVRNFK